jgi:hypothetical protein
MQTVEDRIKKVKIEVKNKAIGQAIHRVEIVGRRDANSRRQDI